METKMYAIESPTYGMVFIYDCSGRFYLEAAGEIKPITAADAARFI